VSLLSWIASRSALPRSRSGRGAARRAGATAGLATLRPGAGLDARPDFTGGFAVAFGFGLTVLLVFVPDRFPRFVATFVVPSLRLR
jgi:hypothetical protein